jgi:hypothetical protein
MKLHLHKGIRATSQTYRYTYYTHIKWKTQTTRLAWFALFSRHKANAAGRAEVLLLVPLRLYSNIIFIYLPFHPCGTLTSEGLSLSRQIMILRMHNLKRWPNSVTHRAKPVENIRSRASQVEPTRYFTTIVRPKPQVEPTRYFTTIVRPFRLFPLRL